MSTAYNMEGKDLHSGVEARLQQLTSQNNPVARLARNKRAMAASAASRSRGHQILAKRRAILGKKPEAKKSGLHGSFARRRVTGRMKKAAMKAAMK